MSSALVRQALEFVDPDETSGKRKKRGSAKRRRPAGQGLPRVDSSKVKNSIISKDKNSKISEEVIKKLLELSKPAVDSSVSDKIVERAVKGRPLLETVPVNKTKEKSILFPEEDFDTFEEELFCS